MLLPRSKVVGISARIEDEAERARLKSLMAELTAGGAGHGLRGGKRKLVRRPLDEVLERELVPPAGQVVLVQLRLLGSLAAVRCGRGQHKLQLHLKAEDRGKRLLEQIGIARRRKPHDNVVGNLQDDDVRALKIQQIEVLDENSV